MKTENHTPKTTHRKPSTKKQLCSGLVHVALNCSVCGVEKTEFKAAKNR